MKVKDGVPPPAYATAVPALFEALLDVFAPLEVAVAIDDAQLEIARVDPVRGFGTDALWCDEELTRDPLTRCSPALGTDVVAELHDKLAGIAPARFAIHAAGAVRHRAAGTATAAWYGRWRSDGLQSIVTVGFDQRGFALDCPLDGYPFMPVRPLASKLAAGDRALAAENRALWLPALCDVRAALGFDREEVEWSALGDALLRKDWLPRLRAS
jgi:hypothetical protein